MSTDAIMLLKADHKELRRLFREFDQAGERAVRKKDDLVKRILSLLTVHTYIENVSHHMEEEEQEWFPKVRAGLSRKQLQQIGVLLEEARRKAPTKPSQPSALKKTIDAVLA